MPRRNRRMPPEETRQFDSTEKWTRRLMREFGQPQRSNLTSEKGKGSVKNAEK